MSTLANLDKTLNRQLKDPVVSTVLRVVLVLYILMLSSVDQSILDLFENIYFQVFYFASMAYVALIDPITAIMMASAYLFTVQQLKSRTRPVAGVAAAALPVVTMQPANASVNGPSVMLPTNATPEKFENEATVSAGAANLFTSDAQFNDVQSNALAGVDQNASVKSLSNQYGAQGINMAAEPWHNPPSWNLQ